GARDVEHAILQDEAQPHAPRSLERRERERRVRRVGHRGRRRATLRRQRNRGQEQKDEQRSTHERFHSPPRPSTPASRLSTVTVDSPVSYPLPVWVIRSARASVTMPP